jgi:hypothetical protein
MKRNFRRRCRNGTSAFFARAPGEASETQMRAVESSEISGRRERERENYGPQQPYRVRRFCTRRPVLLEISALSEASGEC